MEQLERLIKNIGKESIVTVFQTISDIKNHLQSREDSITVHEQDLRQLIEDFKIEEENIIREIDSASNGEARMIRPEEKKRIYQLKERRDLLNKDLTLIRLQAENKIIEQRRELESKRGKLAQAVVLLKDDYLRFSNVRDQLNEQKHEMDVKIEDIAHKQKTLSNMLISAKKTKETAQIKLKQAFELEKRNLKIAVSVDSAAADIVKRRKKNREIVQKLDSDRLALDNKRQNLASISQKLENKRQQVESEKAIVNEQMRIFRTHASKKLDKAITQTKLEHKRYFEHELKRVENTRVELYAKIEENETGILKVSILEKKLEKKRIKLLQIEDTLIAKQAKLEREYKTLEQESKEIRSRAVQLEHDSNIADQRTKGIVKAEIELKKVEKDLIKREKTLLNKEQHLNTFEARKMAQWDKRELKLSQLDKDLKIRENDLKNSQTIILSHELKVNEYENKVSKRENDLKSNISLHKNNIDIYQTDRKKLEKQAEELEIISLQLNEEKHALSTWQSELTVREKSLNSSKIEVEDLALELERERRESKQMRDKLTNQLSSLNSAVREFQVDSPALTEVKINRIPQREHFRRQSMDI